MAIIREGNGGSGRGVDVVGPRVELILFKSELKLPGGGPEGAKEALHGPKLLVLLILLLLLLLLLLQLLLLLLVAVGAGLLPIRFPEDLEAASCQLPSVEASSWLENGLPSFSTRRWVGVAEEAGS